MWLPLAFTSAFFLGFYDVFKKKALIANNVLSVLFLNTLFSSCIFIPFIMASRLGWVDADNLFFTQSYGLREHLYILLKSVIVLCSWVCGYYGMKNLPITIVGPINATRPVMVLIGALTLLGEHLNAWQWAGVSIAIFSFYWMSRSGKREGIDFRHNKWILLVVLSNVFGAISGLYDRYLMSPTGVGLDKMAVQSWFNIYQTLILIFPILILSKVRTNVCNLLTPSSAMQVKSLLTVFCISLCLSAADFVYFYALSSPDAMISVVSMIRRGSVVVSFMVGAFIFKERNLRAKAIDLLLVILSMLALYIGSH